MASVSLPLWKPGLPLDSRSVCPFFLKESLFCCFCLKSALDFLLLFFFSFSLRVTLLSTELMVFPLWRMGKQFLIGLTLGIFSLLPFFPLALYTMYNVVIFCHPKSIRSRLFISHILIDFTI